MHTLTHEQPVTGAVRQKGGPEGPSRQISAAPVRGRRAGTGHVSRARLAGRLVSSAAVLFLFADALGKLLRPQAVVDGTIALGYSPDIVLTLGIIELVGLALYLTRGTALLGAVLLTGYLGGAVASHARLNDPLLTHVLFPVYVATLLWIGMAMCDPRLAAFFPWRHESGTDAGAGDE